MARISSYGIDAKPELADKVIGTDTGKNNATKKVPMKGPVKDLIKSQCSFFSMLELDFKNR